MTMTTEEYIKFYKKQISIKKRDLEDYRENGSMTDTGGWIDPSLFHCKELEERIAKYEAELEKYKARLAKEQAAAALAEKKKK